MRKIALYVGVGSVCLAMLAAGPAGAQSKPKVFTYPTKGQSPEQQKKDTQECQAWASEQAPETQAPQGAGQHARGTLGGAAKGAAVGAAMGAIAGNAGKGAGIGAVAGGAMGRRGSKAGAAQAKAQEGNDWARAFAACMESRGYSVK